MNEWLISLVMMSLLWAGTTFITLRRNGEAARNAVKKVSDESIRSQADIKNSIDNLVLANMEIAKKQDEQRVSASDLFKELAEMRRNCAGITANFDQRIKTNERDIKDKPK